jgi:2,4-dienoyl-CoA reductase-like NADH-dependent reductase (Old Yellow Enzyme family)
MPSPSSPFRLKHPRLKDRIMTQINAASDAIMPWFQQLADAVYGHDRAIMCQITHMSRRSCGDVTDWPPTLPPSQVRDRQHRPFPKTIEPHEIERTPTGYTVGARMRSASTTLPSGGKRRCRVSSRRATGWCTATW